MAPYVVILQSHLLDAMPTAVVAPLLPAEGRKPYAEISAAVDFEGMQYLVSVGELAPIETKRLRRPKGDLLDFEDDIRRALDRLFTGF